MWEFILALGESKNKIKFCCIIPFSKYHYISCCPWRKLCFPILFPYLLILGYLLQAPDDANFFGFPWKFELSEVDSIPLFRKLKNKHSACKLNGEQRIFPIHIISYISLDRIGRIAMIAIKSNEHRSSLLIQSNLALRTPAAEYWHLIIAQLLLIIALSLGKESPYIFCKFNPLRDASLILTLFVAPSVSFLTGFDWCTVIDVFDHFVNIAVVFKSQKHLKLAMWVLVV